MDSGDLEIIVLYSDPVVLSSESMFRKRFNILQDQGSCVMKLYNENSFYQLPPHLKLKKIFFNTLHCAAQLYIRFTDDSAATKHHVYDGLETTVGYVYL